MNKPLSIIIQNDGTVFPDGLNMLLLKLNPKNDVLVLTEDEKAVDFITKQKADLVFINYLIRVNSGEKAAKINLTDYPETRFIMYTQPVNKEILFEMLEIDAHGYVFKNSKRNDLETVIEKVMNGERYHSETINAIIEADLKEHAQFKKTAKEGDMLSPTELDILILVCKGYLNAEIAEMKFISVRTVETHRYNIRVKLGTKNFRDKLQYAINNKIITSLDFFLT